MASISNISSRKCDWRRHISEGDSLEAYDGRGHTRGWFAATVYRVKSQPDTDNKDVLVGYDNYSSSYDFWCSMHSKEIRPTIGFLIKKMVVPQAKQIHALKEENQRLKAENENLLKFKKRYNEAEYEYLAVKKLTPLLKTDDSSFDIMKEVEDQEEIEDLLMDNVSVLSEWNKITKELNTMNDELSSKMRSQDLNIKGFVRMQRMIEKGTEIQQQRLESSHTNIIIPVMNRMLQIDDQSKAFAAELERIKTDNDYLAKCSTRNECRQLLQSLYDLHRYCNQQIDKANELNKKDFEIRNEIGTLQNYIQQYTEYSASYFELLKGYQKFQVLNKEYISNSAKQIDAGWKQMESLWFKWQSEDVLLWMQHKMKWINASAVPNCLDFKVILQNMQKKQMNGRSLLSLNKGDLLNIGFDIHSHRAELITHIKSLIAKNKIANNTRHKYDYDDDDVADGIDENEPNVAIAPHDTSVNDENEGQQSHTMTVDVPSKYKCALTNALMSDPVICGHNNKIFDKTAICQYIRDNGKLPMDDATNSINCNDEASFLLFDCINLTIEIEQFKQEHHL